MFVEALVLAFACAISFAIFYRNRIQTFISLVKFSNTLKGPTILETVANAKRERECV